MDRSSRQKINKEKAALNDTLGQMDSVDIYRSFHPKAAKYTLFSGAHGMFSRTDYTLGHKTSLNTLKMIEIILGIFSDQNAMKLEINHKKKTEKYMKTWKLNNMLLNNEWVNNKLKEEIKRYLETNHYENTATPNL